MAGQNLLSQGKTLGIIGLTQKDWPLLVAAKKLGLNVGAYVDHSQPQLTKLADFTIVGNYRDRDKLTEFGQNSDLVIYASSLIAPVAINYLTNFTQVPQGVAALEIVQDRLMERAFLDEINVNVSPYVTVISLDDVYQSIDSIGYPAVLKPIQRGLGEQSLRINHQSDIAYGDDYIQGGAYLLESWIDHNTEYSLTVATDGETVVAYPLVEEFFNEDRELIEATTPTEVPDAMRDEMVRIATEIAKKLGYRGVITVRFYATAAGALYVNSFDLEPTISGNIFDEVAGVNQYEQMLRVIGGMAIHKFHQLQPAVLVPLYDNQLASATRQQVLKENWKFRFFPADTTRTKGVKGLVWVTGGPDSLLSDLLNQVDTTEILRPKTSPTQPAPEEE
ncbi:ATP-grasp domain-containing protein [Limosilactobacillus fermentum]|uniref:ATP-grasp domain-containing protein n=1 Tax=Limosilactobacillus fermentum TaxID=1613 RepID=UPI0038912241